MICDEDFVSSFLDTPSFSECLQTLESSSPDAVAYAYSDDTHLWHKLIKLDRCDRSDLASIFVFLSNLQFLSPFRIISNVLSRTASRQVWCHKCNGIFLPQSVSMHDTELLLSYPNCTSGCAFDLLKPQYSGSGLPENLISAIFSRAIRSLCQLHEIGWLHRAICARHVLFVRSDENSDELDVAFCGLGSITHVRPFGSCINRTDLPVIDFSWRGWHYQNFLDTLHSAHPIAWYSPEMISQDLKGYGKPTDVYSMGLLLGELFTGIPPFVGITSPSLIFLKKLFLEEPISLVNADGDVPSSELVDIFDKCTRVSPGQRPSTEELLKEPWIKAGLKLPLREADLAPFR